MKVLLSTRLPQEGFKELKENFEVIMPEQDMFTREEIKKLLPHFDAFIPTFQMKVDKEILDIASQKVKIIANYGVGYNNIDVDYATQCGIIVTNTPDPVIEPTAEMTFALMLAAARHIPECDRKLRIPGGLKWGVMENLGLSLYGKTLGIIGMGRIGQAVARRGKAFGMNIVYHNRSRLPQEIEAAFQATRLNIDELVQTADVISLHTPLTEETKHLINYEKFKLMKSQTILINTARGPVINEKDLVKALSNKMIYAAGLDVFEYEPEISKELLTMDNVVLTPHNGTATTDARNEMSRFASQNIIRYFAGRKDITRVN